MLNIKITGGDPSNGNLEFEVNGKRGNGDGDAKRNWQIHWMVESDKLDISIVDIRMKTVPNNTDIFTNDPPTPKDPNGKHWIARVDGDAPEHVDYYYDIEWEGSSGVRTHDPKISVKP